MRATVVAFKLNDSATKYFTNGNIVADGTLLPNNCTIIRYSLFIDIVN
jgi:hypothetical protein